MNITNSLHASFGFDLFRNKISQTNSTCKHLAANWQLVEEHLGHFRQYVYTPQIVEY
jgi:hypothetical protein